MAAVRVLAKRYELVGLLGRGGTGEVWEAWDRTAARPVAVKLLPVGAADGGAVELLFHEARTAGALRHPGVLAVHEVGRDRADDTVFLVMELLRGRSLAAVLREEGPPAVPVAVEWAAQVAGALGAAHRAGVVHRDIRPGNLLLTEEGRVVVLDFGTARFTAAASGTGRRVGTPAYAPPERFRELPGDAGADLYSLGCVLHELLTGQPPFEAAGAAVTRTAQLDRVPVPPSALRPEVPAELDRLVAALLAEEPKARPGSAREVELELRAASLPAAATAPVDPSERPVSRRRFGRRGLLWAAGGVLAAAGTGAGFALAERGSAAVAFQPWHCRTVGGVATAPAVDNGVVYVGDDAGYLYALDAAGGNRRWVYDAEGPVSSPAVTRQLALVTDDSGHALALDTATGDNRLQYSAPGLNATPAVFEGLAVVAGQASGLQAIDIGTGTLKWTCPITVATTPVVQEDLVVAAGQDGYLYGVNAADGSQKWSYDLGAVPSAPAVASGVAYVGDGSGCLHAVSTDEGAAQWTFQAGAALGQPRADGTRVFVGGADSRLYAVDFATGSLRWSTGTSGRVRTPPAVWNGVAFASTGDGTLHALDTRTGTVRWTFRGSGPLGPPLAWAQAVYVGSAQGDFYALDARTGAVPS